MFPLHLVIYERYLDLTPSELEYRKFLNDEICDNIDALRAAYVDRSSAIANALSLSFEDLLVLQTPVVFTTHLEYINLINIPDKVNNRVVSKPNHTVLCFGKYILDFLYQPRVVLTREYIDGLRSVNSLPVISSSFDRRRTFLPVDNIEALYNYGYKPSTNNG